MQDKFSKDTPKSLTAEQQEQFKADFLLDFGFLKSKNRQNAIRTESMERHTVIKKPNPHAALQQKDVKRVKGEAQKIVDKYEFDSNDLKVWDKISTSNSLSQAITSGDLPSDDEENSVMVKLTQNFADKMLQKDLSWLRKIIEIGIYSRAQTFGNCQEKAFFGFSALLNEMPKGLITSLRLATFNNHFIVIVNERFLMDPWLNLAFPLNPDDLDANIGKVFSGFGKLVNYFYIDSLGRCISYQVTEDSQTQIDEVSELDMYSCFQLLEKHKNYWIQPEFNDLSTTTNEQKKTKKRLALSDKEETPFKYQKERQSSETEKDDLSDVVPSIQTHSSNNFVFFQVEDNGLVFQSVHPGSENDDLTEEEISQSELF